MLSPRMKATLSSSALESFQNASGNVDFLFRGLVSVALPSIMPAYPRSLALLATFPTKLQLVPSFVRKEVYSVV